MPLLLLLFHPIRLGTQVDLGMGASRWRTVPVEGRCLKTGRWHSVTQENLTTSSESERESKERVSKKIFWSSLSGIIRTIPWIVIFEHLVSTVLGTTGTTRLINLYITLTLIDLSHPFP